MKSDTRYEKQLAEDIIKATDPIRERANELLPIINIADVAAEGRKSESQCIEDYKGSKGDNRVPAFLKNKARLLTWLDLKDQVYD